MVPVFRHLLDPRSGNRFGLVTPPPMPTRYHIGSKGLKSAFSAYAKRFGLLEVPIEVGDDGVAPTLATLRRWRKEAPPSFVFSAVLPQRVASLEGDPLAVLPAFQKAADALEAKCILLRTPATVTPAKRWRDRIATLAEALVRDVVHVCWEPSGLWEGPDAALFAKKLGLVMVVDAARDPVPEGPVAYVRLRALGETRSFGGRVLEHVVLSIGERRDVYVVLETDTALKEAKRLRKIVHEGAKHDGGRVLRPRGALAIRDDEQDE